MSHWALLGNRELFTLRLLDGNSRSKQCVAEISLRLFDDGTIDRESILMVLVHRSINIKRVWQELVDCQSHDDFADVLCTMLLEHRDNLHLVASIEYSGERQEIYSGHTDIAAQRARLVTLIKDGVNRLTTIGR